jgi:hypothetical protein
MPVNFTCCRKKENKTSILKVSLYEELLASLGVVVPWWVRPEE